MDEPNSVHSAIVTVIFSCSVSLTKSFQSLITISKLKLEPKEVLIFESAKALLEKAAVFADLVKAEREINPKNRPEIGFLLQQISIQVVLLRQNIVMTIRKIRKYSNDPIIPGLEPCIVCFSTCIKDIVAFGKVFFYSSFIFSHSSLYHSFVIMYFNLHQGYCCFWKSIFSILSFIENRILQY
jgi:hypothetical protein